MARRTIVTFEHNGDPWPVVERWAGQNGYRPKPAQGASRRYQKGHGVWVAPMMLEVKAGDNQVSVEGWVGLGPASRVVAFLALLVLLVGFGWLISYDPAVLVPTAAVGAIFVAVLLLIIPTEMGLESGGLVLALPRRLARNATNRLLVEFGQQTIP